MDNPNTVSEKTPSIFDERPADPEEPYRFDKPRRNFSVVKGFLYIAGTIFVIIVIVFIYTIFIQPLLPLPEYPSETHRTDTTNTISSFALWKTYRMSNIGEFKYPREWYVLVERGEPNALVGISDKTSRTDQHIGSVFLEVSGSDADKSFDAVLAKESGTIEKGITSTQTILEHSTINGHPAVTYALETPVANGDYTHSIVTLIKGPHAINISTLSVKNNGKSYDVFIKTYLPIHKQVSSSFTFSK